MDDGILPDDRDELTGDEEVSPDGSGAYGWAPLVDETRTELPPEEFANPSGVGRGECEEGPDESGECDLEVTAQVDDLVLEETKPGFGISGFEGEEDGGG